MPRWQRIGRRQPPGCLAGFRFFLPAPQRARGEERAHVARRFFAGGRGPGAPALASGRWTRSRRSRTGRGKTCGPAGALSGEPRKVAFAKTPRASRDHGTSHRVSIAPQDGPALSDIIRFKRTETSTEIAGSYTDSLDPGRRRTHDIQPQRKEEMRLGYRATTLGWTTCEPF